MVVVKGEVGSWGGGQRCAHGCGITTLTACSRSCHSWGCVHMAAKVHLTQEPPQPSPDKFLFTELWTVISHYVSKVFLWVAETWTQSKVHDMKCSHQAFIHRVSPRQPSDACVLTALVVYKPFCLYHLNFVQNGFHKHWEWYYQSETTL